MKTLFVACSLVLLSVLSGCSQPEVHNYSIINKADWAIPSNDSVTYSFGEYQGQKALLMHRKIGNYKAGTPVYPIVLNFTDGIIEADMAWIGKQGGYLGLAFRIQDSHHYECIYFRPESSGTINAVQYMPEKKSVFNWWDYEANKYQAVATLPMHDWFHIKLVVKGSTLTVFVNNTPGPAMIYKNLDKSLPNGSVGYWFGNSQEGAFKNLVVTNN